MNKQPEKYWFSSCASLVAVAAFALITMANDVCAATPPHTEFVVPFEPELRGKEPGPQGKMSVGEIFSNIGERAPLVSRDELQGRLLQALGNDDVAEANRLLELGARPDLVFTSQGMTPIMAAESAVMAQVLLDRGADPMAVDADGGSALHYAVSRPKAPELIVFFTDNGVDPNLRGWESEPAIFVAANYFYETRAFEPDLVFTDDSILVDQSTSHGRASPRAVLEALVSSGADINARDDSDNTLLMNAAVQDNSEMVKLLLELGADKSLKTSDGTTAQDLAYQLGRRYIYQLLE